MSSRRKNNVCHRYDEDDGYGEGNRRHFHDQGGRDEGVGLSQGLSQVSDGEATEDNGDGNHKYQQQHVDKKKRKWGGEKKRNGKHVQQGTEPFLCLGFHCRDVISIRAESIGASTTNATAAR